MNTLEVRPSDLLNPDARVGDEVTLTVTGRIRKIEDELVDVTQLGGRPAYTSGHRTIEILVSHIFRDGA